MIASHRSTPGSRSRHLVLRLVLRLAPRTLWALVGLAACSGHGEDTRGSATATMGFTTMESSGAETSSGTSTGVSTGTSTTAAETTAVTTSTTAPAPYCGDGTIDPGEACDDGDADNEDECLDSCVSASCGDGYVYAVYEACDDGNDDDDDGCIACELAVCGDGHVYAGVEECDDGNNNDADACSNECHAHVCGDGVTDPGEECDDGGESTTCDVDCTVAECGDGELNPTSGEACDDANLDDDDACVGPCQIASCGDGYVQFGVEACDDGNQVAADGCEADCTLTPKYTAVGPQAGIEAATLIGWTPCHTATYKDSGTTLASILAKCDKANLMLACRPVGSTKYSVLAHAPREDVLFATGTGNTPHNANGVGWYYDGNYSWGFAKEGDAIQRLKCDTQNTNGPQRLCWHTNTDTLGAGWRCGTNINLTNDTWERVILHAE